MPIQELSGAQQREAEIQGPTIPAGAGSGAVEPGPSPRVLSDTGGNMTSLGAEPVQFSGHPNVTAQRGSLSPDPPGRRLSVEEARNLWVARRATARQTRPGSVLPSPHQLGDTSSVRLGDRLGHEASTIPHHPVGDQRSLASEPRVNSPSVQR